MIFSKKLFSILVFFFFLGNSSAEESIAETLKQAKVQEQKNIEMFKKISESFIFIGGGSAVCISADGLMLTNQHVCATADTWTVHDVKGKKYTAHVLGRDTSGDLALLQIDNVKDMKFAKFAGDNSVKIGQPALAVGDPFKLGMSDFIPSITMGIVSGEHLFMEGFYSYTYSDAVQTDTAINPGNSGGPLFNNKGEIIGINGQIRSTGVRANRGIGLAISSDRIKRYLPALKTAKGGIVMHGDIIGITIKQHEETHTRGLIVTSVLADSLAERKGLQQGDIIRKMNGHSTHSVNQYNNMLMSHLPNTPISIEITRNQKLIKLNYKLDCRPAPPRNFGPNFKPKGLTRNGQIQFRTGLSLNEDTLEINAIEEGSPADASGLLKGDIIISLNNNTKNIPELLKKLKQPKVISRDSYNNQLTNIKIKRKVKGSDLSYEFLTTLKLDIRY